MASKKCPKCGEDNPAEAVMCWACYTPLGGGVAVAAGAAAGAAAAAVPANAAKGAAVTTEKDSKDLDPKVIGLVAFIVVAIGGGIYFNLPKAADSEAEVAATGKTAVDPGESKPAAAATRTLLPAIASPQPAAGAAGTVIVNQNYNTISQPNPAFSTGTVGLLTKDSAITPKQAVGIAKFARQQLMLNGRWENMQVVVFNDIDNARLFQQYQASPGRKNSKLYPTDYQKLADQRVWTGAIAYYETVGSREYAYFPSKSPDSWWARNR